MPFSAFINCAAVVLDKIEELLNNLTIPEDFKRIVLLVYYT